MTTMVMTTMTIMMVDDERLDTAQEFFIAFPMSGISGMEGCFFAYKGQHRWNGWIQGKSWGFLIPRIYYFHFSNWLFFGIFGYWFQQVDSFSILYNLFTPPLFRDFSNFGLRLSRRQIVPFAMSIGGSG
jgi:hypothetical protein